MSFVGVVGIGVNRGDGSVRSEVFCATQRSNWLPNGHDCVACRKTPETGLNRRGGPLMAAKGWEVGYDERRKHLNASCCNSGF